MPNNAGYHKYRVFVDLMGSKYLGRTLCCMLLTDYIGGGSSEGGPPVKYFMLRLIMTGAILS